LTKSSSQHSVGAACAVAAKRAKIQGRNGTHPVYDKHGDEVIDDNKYDNDDGHLPVTDASHSVSTMDAERNALIDTRAAELTKKHHQEFMKRAFLLRVLGKDLPLATASVMIKCAGSQKTLTTSSIVSGIGKWVFVSRLWNIVLKGIGELAFNVKTSRAPSMSCSMSLRRLKFLDKTCLAQF
jgi:hypothetical protein